LWNPRGASLAEAWNGFGSPAGTLAVVGGADVYALFWGVGYDAFHLTRVAQARLPGGRPVFRDLSTSRTPEDVLASHGLRPGRTQTLDPAAGVMLVTWQP
jgi:dihydrofolate reductase